MPPSSSPSPSPSVAFCITCKGRAQHIELTLPKNLADNARCESSKFILLDYNSQDHLQPYLQTHHQADIESGRLIVYSSPSQVGFRMAPAKNMAHRLGILEGADVLVNLDADNYTGEGFGDYIASEFAAHRGMFMWARMIQHGPGRMPRGINGRIAVTPDQFFNVGGYDEKYHTWSPDDKDFNLRLRRLGYQTREIDPRYLDAVRHNDKLRFREYKHVSGAPDESLIQYETVDSSDTTVVNYGQFGMGTVYRNFNFEDPIELGPVPTRIFGIGMHKTGTTSLHHALRILGLDSAHWENAHWAKAIWEEMRTSGTSRTLEKHYALSDLPIPLLYRELDDAYPGSKFILTTRNEASWIESVKNHWSHEHNKFRGSWSTDPFTHRVHRELYGQKGFDAEIFLARFRQHNADVLEYFKYRRRDPQDLLVMDMDSGSSFWPELCDFLSKPIPSTSYPVVLPTPKRVPQ
jgi:hypothetical protein